MSFGRCLFRSRYLRLVTPAPPGRRYLGAVVTVRSEHTVASEIHYWFGHENHQACDEVRRFEDDVRRTSSQSHTYQPWTVSYNSLDLMC